MPTQRFMWIPEEHLRVQTCPGEAQIASFESEAKPAADGQ